MGSGASFQPQVDAYDNLAQFAVEGTQSSPKAEKKDGPELKSVLEVCYLWSRFGIQMGSLDAMTYIACSVATLLHGRN